MFDEKEMPLHDTYNIVCNTEMSCDSNDNHTMMVLGTAYLQLYNDYFEGDVLSFHSDAELAIIADTCLEIYGSYRVTPRDEWKPEWCGMYNLMTCFMYLYKRISKGLNGTMPISQ